MLLDFVNEELLVQVVSENTRKGKSLLDIVLTSDEDIIYNVKVEKTNLDTDHDMVKCDILLRVELSKTQFSQSKVGPNKM